MATDNDFLPSGDGSDDEETIAVEEAQHEAGGTHDNDVSTQQEVEALRREMELPIEELLRSLPPEVLERPAEITVMDDNDVSSSSADEADTSKSSKKSQVELHVKT